MTYVYLDDGFPDHEKVADAGGDAAWLYVCGMCYVNRNLTGGRIPKSVVARLSDRKRPLALAARLVEVNLWEDDGTHFVIHNYGVRNASAEKKRQARVEKARKAAEARWVGQGTGPPDMLGASGEHAPSMPGAMLQASGEHAPSNAPSSPPARACTGVPDSPTPRLPDSRGGVLVSDEHLAATGSLAPPAATPSGGDPLWESVLAACGVDPGDVTASSRGAYAKAVADLRQVHADPAEVERRAAGYRSRWPQASLTPSALARHWAECAPAAVLAPVQGRSDGALLRARERSAG